MNYTYRVIIDSDERGFHGYVPALPGCHTWGKTMADTKKNLNEAIALYLESLIAHKEPIPHDQSFESFETVEIFGRRRMRGTTRKKEYA